jgi:hypothetical protein
LRVFHQDVENKKGAKKMEKKLVNATLTITTALLLTSIFCATVTAYSVDQPRNSWSFTASQLNTQASANAGITFYFYPKTDFKLTCTNEGTKNGTNTAYIDLFLKGDLATAPFIRVLFTPTTLQIFSDGITGEALTINANPNGNTKPQWSLYSNGLEVYATYFDTKNDTQTTIPIIISEKYNFTRAILVAFDAYTAGTITFSATPINGAQNITNSFTAIIIITVVITIIPTVVVYKKARKT